MTDQTYEARSEEALERALFKTRAYAPWHAYDPGRDAPLSDRFAALPTTDKAFIRSAFPDGLVPLDKDLRLGLERGEVELVPTSGTTDERVTNVWNQRWWDFSERESWALNSATQGVCTGSHREAILTSARNVGFLSDDRPLSFDERRVGRLLFLNERSSPLLWDDSYIRRMAGELEAYNPEVLEANPSYLALFSRGASRLGLAVTQPRAIVFTYENPSLIHIRQIRQVFDAPVTSSYGTTEIGYAFMGCERGFHHLNSTSCRVDFVPLEGADPEVGSIRVTPFGNEWVSLLRFDPGDVVRVEERAVCPCGRNGAILLQSVEGRVKSLTRSIEGRPVTAGELDRALAAEESLLAYQLLEVGRGEFCLRAVLDEKGSRGASERLRDVLAALYGKASRVRVEPCEAIEPETSGKFLPAKSLPAARS